MFTTVTALFVILVVFVVGLFFARRLLRLALKLALIAAVIFALFVGGILGWWLGWFGSSSRPERPQANQRSTPTRRPSR